MLKGPCTVPGIQTRVSGNQGSTFLPVLFPQSFQGFRGVGTLGLVYLIGVGPILMLCSVAGIAEGFAAALVLTHVRLLPSV